MPSTYSPSLRLELIGAGEQAANWGNTTNYNLGTLLEQAIAGVQSVAVSGASYTLTTGSGVVDEARNAVLVLTGTLAASCNVIVPTADKTYTFQNATTGGFSVVVKTAAGSGVTIDNGFTQQVYCDATNVVAAGVPFNAATNTITTNVSGNVSGNVAAGAGSAAVPSVTFGDTDTGVYGPTVNELGFSANGTEVLRLSASALSYISGSNSINLTTNGSIEITRNGGGGYIDIKSAAGEDADVRIFETGNGIGFQTGGNGALATRMVINSTGQIQSVGSGTAAAPAYSFSGDTDTGIYSVAPNTVGFGLGGVEYLRVDGTNLTYTNNNAGGSNGVMLTLDGSIEITRGSGGAYIDFKNGAGEDADARIFESSNGLAFQTGGNGAIATRMTIPGSGAISMVGPVNVSSGDLDVAGNLRFNSGYGSAALAYGVRAWVNFNGTGTVAIRASGNVSSITDNGTGNYTVNFTNAIVDANYSFALNAGNPSGSGEDLWAQIQNAAPTVSALRFSTSRNGTGPYDAPYVSAVIFR